MNTSTRMQQSLQQTRQSTRHLAVDLPGQAPAVLTALAERAWSKRDQILAANQLDLARMDEADPKYDRLLLNEERLHAICEDLRKVAGFADPLGRELESRRLDNGLELSKVTVPLGVIGIVFESRPNVTFDVFALSLRSGNACVLKGSRDAEDSNKVIVAIMHEVLEDFGLPPAAVYLAPAEREALPEILNAVGLIDVVIPRGSQGLIDFVRDHAKVPVIETGAGIVHTYVDESADLLKACAIVTNAKSRRVSVCNALDTLLIHVSRLGDLPGIVHQLGAEHNVTIYADEAAYQQLDGVYPAQLLAADPSSFGTEFLDYKMSIACVDSLQAALDHIDRYSSRHSEAIIAEDPTVVEQFLVGVDAAAVYANSSTAFTDGGQFGMGAEIGISTQKLHARGPMALAELTSYKWLIRGDGQIRAS